MASTLPKKVKLNNHEWTVNFTTQEYIDKNMIDQGPPGHYAGYCNDRGLEIALTNRAHKQDIPRTFLHEVLHACFRGNHMLNVETEEAVVRHLEDRLTDFFKNNSKAIKYLQENL
jgi:hypothetical protein